MKQKPAFFFCLLSCIAPRARLRARPKEDARRWQQRHSSVLATTVACAQTEGPPMLWISTSGCEEARFGLVSGNGSPKDGTRNAIAMPPSTALFPARFVLSEHVRLSLFQGPLSSYRYCVWRFVRRHALGSGPGRGIGPCVTRSLNNRAAAVSTFSMVTVAGKTGDWMDRQMSRHGVGFGGGIGRSQKSESRMRGHMGE